ncbi:hypothetical protein P5L48_004208 [Escherichia coli]|nr:hypothetical protein [Escherichia coli]
MNEPIKATVRLKKKESADLQALAFLLNKESLKHGQERHFTESDLIHFVLENTLNCVEVTRGGYLSLNREKMAEVITGLETRNGERAAR